VLSRIVAAVRQKVVSICQQGTDMSLHCIVDAVLAKLDSVSDTDDKNRQLVLKTNLKVQSHFYTRQKVITGSKVRK